MERAQKEKEAEKLNSSVSTSVCPPVPSVSENIKKVVIPPAVRSIT